MASLVSLTAEGDSLSAARSQVGLELPAGMCVILETIEADGAHAKGGFLGLGRKRAESAASARPSAKIHVWAGDPELKPVVLAIKSWYRERAGKKTGAGVCDSCNGHLVRGNSYLMPYLRPEDAQLYCEPCTNKLLGQNVDWDKAVRDIDGWVGPGVPSSVKTMISSLHLS